MLFLTPESDAPTFYSTQILRLDVHVCMVASCYAKGEYSIGIFISLTSIYHCSWIFIPYIYFKVDAGICELPMDVLLRLESVYITQFESVLCLILLHLDSGHKYFNNNVQN